MAALKKIEDDRPIRPSDIQVRYDAINARALEEQRKILAQEQALKKELEEIGDGSETIERYERQLEECFPTNFLHLRKQVRAGSSRRGALSAHRAGHVRALAPLHAMGMRATRLAHLPNPPTFSFHAALFALPAISARCTPSLPSTLALAAPLPHPSTHLLRTTHLLPAHTRLPAHTLPPPHTPSFHHTPSSLFPHPSLPTPLFPPLSPHPYLPAGDYLAPPGDLHDDSS